MVRVVNRPPKGKGSKIDQLRESDCFYFLFFYYSLAFLMGHFLLF